MYCAYKSEQFDLKDLRLENSNMFSFTFGTWCGLKNRWSS